MTDQTTPETTEDDDFPPVHFALRNTDGTATQVELRTHTLGLDRYVLITPGSDALEVEASHMDMDNLATALAISLAATMQSGHVNDDLRAEIIELIADED